MPWLKSSDTAAQHPIVLAPLAWPPSDDHPMPHELANTLAGLVWRCATHSAQHTTDYLISDGVVAMYGGPRFVQLAQLAAEAGYWTRDDARRGWLLVDDAEHLFHIRRRSEIDWERARKADVANPALVVPVRLRDGDGCRYCGHIVQWNARRGNRAGTYDHRTPGQSAKSPDDLMVACGLCNRTRSDNPDAQAWPLRPAPVHPYYGPHTVQFLAGYGHHVRTGDPATGGTTPGDPATGGTTPQRSDTRAPDGRSADPAGRGYPADRDPGRVAGTGRRGRRGGARRRSDPGEGR